MIKYMQRGFSMLLISAGIGIVALLISLSYFIMGNRTETLLKPTVAPQPTHSSQPRKKTTVPTNQQSEPIALTFPTEQPPQLYWFTGSAVSLTYPAGWQVKESPLADGKGYFVDIHQTNSQAYSNNVLIQSYDHSSTTDASLIQLYTKLGHKKSSTRIDGKLTTVFTGSLPIKPIPQQETVYIVSGRKYVHFIKSIYSSLQSDQEKEAVFATIIGSLQLE